MIADAFTHMLADITNLCQHINIVKKHLHDCSCLLCQCKNNNPTKTIQKKNAIPPVTSSDLDLLHSETHAVRCAIFDKIVLSAHTVAFRFHLETYLHFTTQKGGIDSPVRCNIPYDILLVVNPLPSALFQNPHHLIIYQLVICTNENRWLCNESIQIPNTVIIFHEDIDRLFRLLLHLLLLHKHRTRICDLSFFSEWTILTSLNPNTCLFL
jgi:hypothetical protein